MYKGSSIYDTHKQIGFLIPSPVHMRLTPRGCPHAGDMKCTSLSWNGWYNDPQDLELKFYQGHCQGRHWGILWSFPLVLGIFLCILRLSTLTEFIWVLIPETAPKYAYETYSVRPLLRIALLSSAIDWNVVN